MKPYQLSGLSFMVHMYENGMSCMLGDEMGLGKTLQTLSLFQFLEERHATLPGVDELRPHLVVCPLSVLQSWVNEAKKFTPGLKVLPFHGPVAERQRLKKMAQGQEDQYGNELIGGGLNRGRRRELQTTIPFHVMVTTYETFEAEKGWFKSAFVWRYVVLDEGHKIKVCKQCPSPY
jgi:SWI/SNF-related matrix-associated actin-dependent regulator of chromatin subfamily A member 5